MKKSNVLIARRLLSKYHYLPALDAKKKKELFFFCNDCGDHWHEKKKHKFQKLDVIQKKFDPNALIASKEEGKLTLVKYIKEQWSSKKELAFQLCEVAIKNGSYAGTILATESSIAVVKGTQHYVNGLAESCKSVKVSGISAGIGTGIVIALEIGWHTYRYFTGQITWKEFGRVCIRTVTTGVISGVSSWGGVCAGAAMGSIVGPVGTIIGGILGGIFAGVVGGYGSNYVFEKYWPSDEEKTRKKMIAQAFTFFNLKVEDINDPVKFNAEIIRKTYKDYAKIFHPDRITGSDEKFKTLGAHYGIVMSILGAKGTVIQDDLIKAILAIEYE